MVSAAGTSCTVIGIFFANFSLSAELCPGKTFFPAKMRICTGYGVIMPFPSSCRLSLSCSLSLCACLLITPCTLHAQPEDSPPPQPLTGSAPPQDIKIHPRIHDLNLQIQHCITKLMHFCYRSPTDPEVIMHLGKKLRTLRTELRNELLHLNGRLPKNTIPSSPGGYGCPLPAASCPLHLQAETQP